MTRPAGAFAEGWSSAGSPKGAIDAAGGASVGVGAVDSCLSSWSCSWVSLHGFLGVFGATGVGATLSMLGELFGGTVPERPVSDACDG